MRLISVRFRDDTETALDDDSLLTGAPDLSSWADDHRLTIYGANFDYSIEATLLWTETGQPPTGVKADGRRQHWLQQNYPNPFNPVTTIEYSVSQESRVRLQVFDARGRVVRTLVNRDLLPNNYKVLWDGRNSSGNSVASGIYFYRLTVGDLSATRKMVLLR